MSELELLEDKIQALDTVIRKLVSDEEYASTVNIPEGMTKEAFIEVATLRLTAARSKSAEIGKLNSEEMAEAYAVTISELDGVLSKFPEYKPIEKRYM